LAERAAGIRIFAVGIDQGVSITFLRRLADLGGGTCDLVESAPHLEQVLGQVHRRLATALLTELQVAGQLDLESLVPHERTELFAGLPLVLLGRWQGGSPELVRLEAKDHDGQPWTIELVPHSADEPVVRACWA